MTSIFKTSMAALLVAAQLGCTSFTPVAPGCQGSACITGLVAGDKVVVNTLNQGTLTLTVQQADGQGIVGQTADKPSRNVVVAAGDISGVQKRELSTMRTTGAVVGTGLAVTTVLVIIGAAGLGAALAAM